ncbi:MAG TPA: cellulase-like family protein, partial [Bacteroidales bacterium]|nr:cellulase-like family protein [Bacteroidales bacterium]
MKRRKFLSVAALSAGSVYSASAFATSQLIKPGMNHWRLNNNNSSVAPRAITMWDFSWLERRWPGAGYEDWDKALDSLKLRGYNAVRIDAFPHLLAANALKEWTLKEVWSIQNWGSPDMNKVRIQPCLNEFIAACEKRDIKVGLSTWFREDLDNNRMEITTPEKHAEIWLKTLDSIEQAGLLDNVMYVDLCNEWP